MKTFLIYLSLLISSACYAGFYDNLRVHLDFSKSGVWTKNGSDKLQTIKNLAPKAEQHFSLNSAGPTWSASDFSGQGGFEFRDSENASIVSDGSFTDIKKEDHTIIYVMERNKNWTGALTATGTETLDQFPQLGAIGWGGYPGGYAAQRTPLDTPFIYVTVNLNGKTTNYLEDTGPVNSYVGDRGHSYTGSVGTLTIGRKSTDSTAKIKMHTYLLYNKALTASEVQTKINEVKERVSVASLYRPVNVVLDGNSLMQATGIAEDMLPTYLPKKLYLPQHCFPLTALGGAKTADLIKRYKEVVLPQVRAGLKNILVIWEGRNHLNTTGVTPAQAVAALDVYSKIALQDFEYVVIGDLLPDANGRVGFEADRLTANTLLAGLASTRVKIVAFAATGNGIGDVGDTAGANYNDGTHLSSPGSEIAAQILADSLIDLL